MSKKILIVGIIGESNKTEELKLELEKQYPDDEIEILNTDIETAKLKGLVANDVLICEPNVFEKMPAIGMPFTPRAKYEPKGHERKHKFHR